MVFSPVELVSRRAGTRAGFFSDSGCCLVFAGELNESKMEICSVQLVSMNAAGGGSVDSINP